MGSVYENGLCNIAATASRDSSQGLSRDRDTSMLQRMECDASFPDVGGGVPRQRFTVLSLNTNYLERGLQEAPLHRRAWVMQERLLARRVLHFIQKEIMWECREHFASEMYPRGWPNITESHIFKDLDDHSQMNSTAFSDVGAYVSAIPYRLWSGIQEGYSACHLTEPMDKLIALSGIAKKFRNITGDVYVAGMWQQNLAAQMLWYTNQTPTFWRVAKGDNPTKVSQATTAFRSPTFSWASIDLPVNIPSIEYDGDPGLLIKIDDIRTEGLHGDATSPLKSCSLRLHGSLKPVR